MPTTLRDWLDTLDSTQLETLLAHHPLALRGAPVRDLDELAMRLEHPSMVSQTMMTVPAPVLQLVETASALGEAATLDRLTATLSAGTADPQTHRENIGHWLGSASASALAWLDGERVRINPGLDQVIVGPLALARPARTILAELTVDQLRDILRAWGLSAPTRKAELLEAVRDQLADPATLRQIAGNAPETVFTSLTEHVTKRLANAATVTTADLIDEDPDDDGFAPFDRHAYAAEQAMWRWAAEAGLAFGYSGYGYAYDTELPTEVYLALAPPDFRVEFAAEPPALATAPVPAEQLQRSSAGALSEFLGTAMAILEGIARTGLKMNKSGGVGSRELTRYAKQIGTDVATVRLTLYLAASLSFLDQPEPTQLTTTAEFDQWRHASPARRAFALLSAWLPLSVPPTLEHDADGTYLPALGRMPDNSGIPVGFMLCRLLSTFERQGALAADDLAALLRWYHPVAITAPGTVQQVVAEGHQLGIFADGALTRLGENISAGEEETAIDLLTEALPAPSNQVMFGSDLTIVIPGSPDPAAVDLLDILATREGHGVVGTWRVSAESVRGALDQGYAVDDLITGLRELADRDLPQALEYLLRDVARKHGHLGVREAAALITSADEALLAEVVASRSLRALGLSLVAPTVAASTQSAEQVLVALRKSGYLPVVVGDGGAPVMQLRRIPGMVAAGDDAAEAAAEPGPGGVDIETDTLSEADEAAFRAEMDAFLGSLPDQPRPPRREPETPADAAARLLSGEAAPADSGAGGNDLERFIAAEARRLSPAEVHELADAVTAHRPVFLRYRSSSGGESNRTVSSLVIDGPHLSGFCHSKQAGRTFRLDQILAVTPA